MSDLAKRLLANTAYADRTAMFDDAPVFNEQFTCQMPIPAINIALSGAMKGGLTAGLTSIAGASKSFKTMFALLMARVYQQQYKDAIVLFYDSEFGSPPAYLRTMGIDTSRVVHTPIMNVEELKFDLMKQLQGLTRKDHVFILVDSLGNLASKKEVEDAKDAKSVADMTRAKSIKSLFRIVTPYFTMLDIPGVVINHVYAGQGMFPTTTVSGGTGVMLSSDTVWIITKSQRKDGTELTGWSFNIGIEKSRFVREKKRIPIIVDYDLGINTYSGLLDIAMLTGHVIKPNKGWYSRVMVNKETGEVIEDKKWRAAETDCKEFWHELMINSDFEEAVKHEYSIGELDSETMVHADDFEFEQPVIAVNEREAEILDDTKVVPGPINGEM